MEDLMTSSEEAYELAMNYYHGTNGYEKDLEAAFYWFACVLDGDFRIDALAQTGHMLALGEGREQDLEQAAFDLFVAADQGHELAKKEFESVKDFIDFDSAKVQRRLGVQYSSIGEQKKAIDWLTKAAEQGDVDSLIWLGGIYSLIDPEKRLEYYHKAYEKGSEEAACLIGCAYEQGEGVEMDYGKAFEYYTFAANKGYPPAMASLASMYEEGRGTEKDAKKAEHWSHLFKVIESQLPYSDYYEYE